MNTKKSVDSALGLPTVEQWNNITGVNLPELSEDDIELYQDEEETDATTISLEEAKLAMAKLKEMRTHLKDIPDITHRKAHLDRLATLAETKFEDIFDRAFNCEDRFAAEMINAANAMLKIALDAHSKIIDSDVKLVDLQLKKDKMEIELNLRPKGDYKDNSEGSIAGEKVVGRTRNDLLNAKKRDK